MEFEDLLKATDEEIEAYVKVKYELKDDLPDGIYDPTGEGKILTGRGGQILFEIALMKQIRNSSNGSKELQYPELPTYEAQREKVASMTEEMLREFIKDITE